MGLIVAKDIRKKLAAPTAQPLPASTVKSEGQTSKFSCPRAVKPMAYQNVEIHLSGRNLADEGLKEVASSLTDALISNRDMKSIIQLQTLDLSANGITTKSLAYLAPAFSLVSEHLEEVDLSGNNFAIETEKQSAQWEEFLDSLEKCQSLKTLNFANSRVGSFKHMEVFARVHTRQYRSNIRDWLKFSSNESDKREDENNPPGLDQVMERLSIDSRLSNQDTSRGDTSLSSNGTDMQPWHMRGLPSVRLINLDNVDLDDCGSLFMSYVLVQRALLRKYAENCTAFETKLEATGNHEEGVSYQREDKLSSYGAKLLKLSEMLASPSEDLGIAAVDFDGATQTLQRKRRVSSSGRHSRRASAMDNAETIHSITSPQLIQYYNEEMESLRRKMQRTALENFSEHGDVDLWKAAIKTLVWGRICTVGLSNSDSQDLQPSNGKSGRRAVNGRRKKEQEPIATRVPLQIWSKIICEVTDPLHTLSDRQSLKILERASDRNTLRLEAEILGKSTSLQLWHVLDSMNCLAYDESV